MNPSPRAEAAFALLRAGKTAEAAAACHDALAADANDAGALHVLGRLAFDQGNRSDAIALLSRAAEADPASARIRHDLGTMHLLSGAPAPALAAFEAALQRAPDDAATLSSAGLALVHLQRPADAVPLLDRATHLAPQHPQAWGTLALALAALGRWEDALTACRTRVQLQPDNPEAHAQLGAVQGRLRLWADALVAYQNATRLAPGFVDAWCAQAHALDALGRREDAVAAFDQALALKPDYAEALSDRAAVLRLLGRTQDAAAGIERALALNPRLPAALGEKALLLSALGRTREALLVLTHLIEIHPGYAPAYNNRGLIWREQGELDQALLDFNAAIRANPGLAEAHDNRGVVLSALRRVAEAEAAHRQALAADPRLASAHNNLGLILLDHAEAEAAGAAFRAAIDLDPAFATAHSNYLWSLQHDPAADMATLFAAHQEWAARFARPAGVFTRHDRDPDPDRRLRIGLVSPQFGRDPVGLQVHALLAATGGANLSYVCYATQPRDDDITSHVKARVDAWRAVADDSDDQLAERIRADGIDILVDLIGHTSGQRLPCLARKPAPVQVEWAISYPFTTAVPAIDYALWDEASIVAGGERWFTERLVHLPYSRFCFGPVIDAPPVADPPAAARGFVTFGSFNNLTKFGPDVVALWARLLQAVPRSRLLLSWRTLADAEERRRVAELWRRHGVPPARLELIEGSGGHQGVLADYGEVDIALDPFPLTGGFSTLEALWMGVPVVTLAGTRPASRQTLSILRGCGLAGWAAEDAETYLRIAIDLAADPERLARLRADQRARLEASPLCDTARFARDFEAALRAMWQKWCTDRQTPVATGSDH